MKEKIIPITNEVSVSMWLIWKLIDMAYSDVEDSFLFIEKVTEEVYEENKKYKSHLTKEAFLDFVDTQVYRRYWEELLKKGRK